MAESAPAFQRFPRSLISISGGAGRVLKSLDTPVLPSSSGDAAQRWLWALLIALLVAATYFSAIVIIDNTNIGTSNGLWKSPNIFAWGHGGGALDDGELFYAPVFGYLARVIPDSLLQYGTPVPDVTFRKMALIDGLFGGIASGLVFVLAFRFTNSRLGAVAISVAHAGSAFVLLNSINSEDIIPAYTFVVAACVCFFEFLYRGGWRLFAASALLLALATLFHWTTMGPALAGFAAVYALLLKKSVNFFLIGLVWLFLFAVFIQALLLLAFPAQHIPVWVALMPGKANVSSGWLGFTGEKVRYLLVGMGNYFSGGQNPSDYQYLYTNSTFFHAMIRSWAVLGLTLAACLIFLVRRPDPKGFHFLAAFALALFVAGEAGAVYSQPQDPQFQIEPMFATIPGMILILQGVTQRAGNWGTRVAVGALALVAVANSGWNLRLMYTGHGQDSEAAAAIEEMDRLFPKRTTAIVSQGFEAWRTWQFVLLWRDDPAGYLENSICFAAPLTSKRGIGATAAAAMFTKQLDDALARGIRVVAAPAWTVPVARLVGDLTTVTDENNARAYISLVKRNYRTGRRWDTKLGPFFEVLPANAVPQP